MKRFITATKASTAAILATAALIGNTPAHAQPSDLDPAVVTAAARYALPVAFDSFLTSCSAELDPAGYAVTNADNLMAKFSDGTDEAWPVAKQAIIAMASEGEDAEEMAAIFDMMGDEELRPFVDALAGSLISQEIKPDDCEFIERALEVLDPLPADNFAEMVGLFFELGAREDDESEDEDESEEDFGDEDEAEDEDAFE